MDYFHILMKCELLYLPYWDKLLTAFRKKLTEIVAENLGQFTSQYFETQKCMLESSRHHLQFFNTPLFPGCK